MANSITVNGTTYSDGDDPATGMGNGGFRTRLLPMLSDTIADLGRNMVTTSATTLAVGIGTKVLTLAAEIPFPVGGFVELTDAAAPANWMWGQATARSGTTLTVDVQVAAGSGSPAAWLVAKSGPRGATGPAWEGPPFELADDTSPQLAGDLDPNGHGIDGPVPKARAATRTVTTSSYATVDSDVNGIVYCSSGSPQSLTLHAAVAGAMIQVAQSGTGQVTVAAGTGTLRYQSGTGPKTRQRYASVYCHFDGTDWWVEGGAA